MTPEAERIDLSALQMARYERANWRAILSGNCLTLAECCELDRYFRRFVAPDPQSKCVNCGRPQGGFLLGCFRWGIVHGEGACSACGYPGRTLHYAVGPIKRLSLILQYHPDDLVETR